MIGVGKMEMMTRIGFAARGLMYLLIGYFALSAGRAEDGADVLSHLSGGLGRGLLGLMALGFLAYGIWRLSEAAIDSEGHGSDGKGIAVRLGGAVSGLIHLALAFTAARLALGGRSGGSGGAEAGASTALGFPGGEIALLLAGAALAITGLYQFAKAAKLDFLKHLDQRAARQTWVIWAGRAGYAARGVVFTIMGVFLFRAARSSNAAEAGDMGDALGSLSGTLQTVIAAGLILFGLFSLVEARFRRINDPRVLERLRAAARTAAPSA